MNCRSLFCIGLMVLGCPLGLVFADSETMMFPPPSPAETYSIPSMTGGAFQDNRRGVIGGVGVYLIQPYFKDNPAFTVSTTSPTGPGGTSRTVTSRSDISHHVDAAPQLWLGYITDCGLGGRVRWWYFRQGTDQAVSVPPAAPGTLTLLSSAAPLSFTAFADSDGRPASLAATSKLQLQVWDIEALHNLQNGKWDLLFAGGLRLAHINQQYNAFVVGDSGGGAGPISATVLSGHSFHGAGPVIAMETRRLVGESGLSLYSSARGAILFGSGKQSATDIFTGAGGTFVDDSGDQRTSVRPVGELELGLEFGRNIRSSHAFGQVALVGQEWWGAGSASRAINTNTFGTPTPGGGAIVDSDLGFLGVVFRLGVNY